MLCQCIFPSIVNFIQSTPAPPFNEYVFNPPDSPLMPLINSISSFQKLCVYCCVDSLRWRAFASAAMGGNIKCVNNRIEEEIRVQNELTKTHLFDLFMPLSYWKWQQSHLWLDLQIVTKKKRISQHCYVSKIKQSLQKSLTLFFKQLRESPLWLMNQRKYQSAKIHKKAKWSIHTWLTLSCY